jgi:ubiquinone/menaquinone biosynthesis C-methylase UbiE
MVRWFDGSTERWCYKTVAMDDELRRSMLRYYDERAAEYEEAYTRGTGTSSIANPEVFRAEAIALAPVIERVASGRLIDLACGTAYWLPAYAPRCTSITLFDQSPRMLDEARQKAAALGVAERCSVVCADFFAYAFPSGAFDTVLAGFFLSHLTPEQEPALFDALRTMLRPGGRFLLLDSAWTPERATANAKIERQPRHLNDGTRFDIYKRYVDRNDIAGWTKYGATVNVEHFGTAFLAVSGEFTQSERFERPIRDTARRTASAAAP